ncbi:hypothetical protein [Mycolicibacter minnesotensis]
MSWRRKLAQLFSEWAHDFDDAVTDALDLFQPSAQAAPIPQGRSAGTSPLRLVPELADKAGRTRTVSPGAAGHPDLNARKGRPS